MEFQKSKKGVSFTLSAIDIFVCRVKKVPGVHVPKMFQKFYENLKLTVL